MQVPTTVRSHVRAAALLAVTFALAGPASAQSTPRAGATDPLTAEIDRRAAAVLDKVVAWREDIHEHPELSDHEVRTAKLVADHLRSLGIETKTGVARTGVVGVLRGGRPGPVVALRADMDALPVTEEVDLPFASKVRATYNGHEVGVMHACGHDNHVAILMGVAEVLAGMRERLPGTVKFIFQPAEEGSSETHAGAELMVREGVLESPKVDAVFGLHVFPYPVGEIRYRPGGIMASAAGLRIVVHGRQTHGAEPWNGVDPVVVASQIVLGLQTIVSRQEDIRNGPAVVTVATINGGVRSNIIPDSVVMTGTVRTLDPAMREDIPKRIERVARGIAQAAGASVDVDVGEGGLVTYNDPDLTESMVPTLRRVAGADHVAVIPPTTTAEDFSEYQAKVPGMFFFLGVTPPGADPDTVAPNHSPRFFADEAALPIGVRALSSLAVDYLRRNGSR